jgi:serine/threonine protein kinase
MVFPYDLIERATSNFGEAQVIGEGGFGKVYRAKLGITDVAIKRLSENSLQTANNFKIELKILCR